MQLHRPSVVADLLEPRKIYFAAAHARERTTRAPGIHGNRHTFFKRSKSIPDAGESHEATLRALSRSRDCRPQPGSRGRNVVDSLPIADAGRRRAGLTTRQGSPRSTGRQKPSSREHGSFIACKSLRPSSQTACGQARRYRTSDRRTRPRYPQTSPPQWIRTGPAGRAG